MSWLSSGLSKLGHGIQNAANKKVLGVSLGSVLGPMGEVVRGGDIKQNFVDDFKAGAKNLPIALPFMTGGNGSAPGGGSGVGSLVDSGLDFLKEHGGQALDLGLGTAGMINAANLGKKSSDYATNAFDLANKNWQTREPLRLAGQAGMLNPTPTTDVNTIGTRARAANPFASKPLPLPVKPNG